MTYLVSLRKMSYVDADLIVKWRNANKQYFPPQPDLTYNSQLWWFSSYVQDPSDHYYIVLANGTPVGTISFNSKTNEIGRVLLGEKGYARKGVMSEALRLLMGSFDAKNYRLRVLARNGAAIAFYERNGFLVTKGEGQMVRMERV